MLYEVSGFAQISGMEMLYKTCGRSNGRGTEFEERRDTALSGLESGVGGGVGGFYTGSYEGVYVLGQCEGDLGGGDCGDCVKNAVQQAQVECGSSVSGQIYLHKCFISYNYYPNGAPKRQDSAASSSSSSSASSTSSPSSGKNCFDFLLHNAWFLHCICLKWKTQILFQTTGQNYFWVVVISVRAHRYK